MSQSNDSTRADAASAPLAPTAGHSEADTAASTLIPPTGHPSGGAAPAMPGRLAQLLVVILGVLPLYLLPWLLRRAHGGAVHLTGMLLYPLLIGGAAIVWLLFLQRRVCRDDLAGLGWRAGGPWSNLGEGLLLTAAYLVIAAATQATVARWAPGRGPSPEIVELILRLSENPWLMLVWLGPVAWIGAALFEELARVFVLRRLWLAWPGTTARNVAVIASALAFGLVHYYQGPPGMVSTGFMGLVAGAVFLFRGRLWPLVVGHAVYDMISIGMGVLQVRGMV